MSIIELTERQLRIIEIVKSNEPITSEEIAQHLNLTRATLRPDLSILTMSKVLYARPKVGYFYGDVTGIGLSLKEIRERTVREAMSLPVTIAENESIHSAIVQMFLEDVGSLFITHEGGLSGVISRKDLLKCSVGGMDIEKLPVSMAMTRMPNVIYARQDESVAMALHKILLHEVDCLPVVEPDMDDEKKLRVVGRFSKTNISRLLMEVLED
ncbi:helix-turn-helix transcriptional regulator [Filifactor villosus]|uniref:Helix-turn-helix transcriptional regulator n=1 Tax=Filifactor villosus TaxID=29374 RepID=A0ABV9QKG4_9FIRM